MAGAALQPLQTQSSQYGGFLERFVAVLIDAIIVCLVLFVISIPLKAVLGVLGALLMIPINLVGGIAYEAYFLSSPKQATIGKQTLGLIVTDVNGGRISTATAILRCIGKFVSALILFIGYIMAAFTPKKQALHDMIAGTLVVKGRRS